MRDAGERAQALYNEWADAFSTALENSTSGQTDVDGDVQYKLRGVAKDGKKIYESNFEKGTPKKAKAQRILDYVRNVWSKKPISLVISNGETSRIIKANFDPTIDETKNIPTDASKLAGGNRHGNHTEQRVTLDLADDYYQIAEDSIYNYSKLETGKTLKTHDDVKMWHYFINDIYFAEHSEDTLTPYTVTINVKEKADGDFVYSFNAEKEPSTRRTLHAAVNTYKGANGELFIDDSMPQESSFVKENISDTQAQARRVTKEQDTAYMDAVNRGDTETAQRMVDEAAREAGYRIKGYHGTGTRFTIFDRRKTSASNDLGQGFYFSSSEFEAERYQKDDTHGDTYNKIYGVAYDNALERIEEMGEDTSDEMLFDRIFNEEFDKELAKRVKDGAVISAYLQMKMPFVVSSSNWITEAEAIEIAKNTMYVDDVPDEIAISDWVHSIKSYAKQHDGKVDTDHFANKMGHSVNLTSALLHQSKYDGILDYTVREKFGESSDYHAIALYANKIKDSSPITYDDNGNVIPLSERFNPENEDIRYSARNRNKNYLDVESRFGVAESVSKYAETVSDPALKAKLKANATTYAKKLDEYETESIRYDNATANGWDEMAAIKKRNQIIKNKAAGSCGFCNLIHIFFGDMCVEKYTYDVRECRANGAPAKLVLWGKQRGARRERTDI